MIAHQYQCIFVHIPKTAGTSIERFLAGDEHLKTKQDHRSIRNLSNSLFPASLSALMSMDTARYCYQNYARWRAGYPGHTRRQFDSYFKFSFVRNPWARVYSWYKNVLRDEQHRRAHGVSRDCSLLDFLTTCEDSWALRPQLSWITDFDGNIAVDFVGRFENLQQDFDRVCDRLSIAGSRLEHLLASENPSYLSAYDDASRKLVATRYAEEIECFNYRFEN